MTIEELLDWPDPATLTDQQIDAILAPFLPLTRPRDLSPAIRHGTLPPDVAARVAELQAQMGGSAKSLLEKLKSKS